MRVRVAIFSFGMALALTSLVGCGQPCDSEHLCDVDSDAKVCDGKNFSSCGDSNRGERIECVRTPRAAVCTPTGWTYDNTGH